MSLLAEIPASQIVSLVVFIAGLTIVTVLLLGRGRRYFAQQQDEAARRQAAEAGQSDGGERAHHLGSPDAITRWEVQMHEIARELSAQLDTKMSALQALISEADRAAGRLERALAGAAGQAPEPALLEPAALERLRQEVYTLADYGFPASEIAHRLGLPVGQVQSILAERPKA